MKKNYKLTHDIVISAKLTNVSPLIMGAQKEDETDLEILKHSNHQPYISGTAFAGKFLKNFESNLKLKQPSEPNKQIVANNLKFLVGSSNKEVDQSDSEEKSQSHVILDNLELVSTNECSIVLNDSNKISKKTGAVENKFNFEKLEPGCQFQLKAHFKIRNGFDVLFFKDVVIYLQRLLKDQFSIGAKTNNGYGQMQLDEFQAKVFDYSTKTAFAEWEDFLKNDQFKNEFQSFKPTYFEYKPQKKVLFNLNLAIKSQFITGEPVYDLADVKKKQSQRVNVASKNFLTSEKAISYFVKGEAVKNALSHRAYRILNTVNPTNQTWVNNLMLYIFGENMDEVANKTSKELNHKKAHLSVKEAKFQNVDEQKQTRIKISRFTGGTINGALTTASPIHSLTDQTTPNIKFEFQLIHDQNNPLFKNAMTLMLMLIKDLFSEDLPIGGEKATGKGILIGCESELIIDSQKIGINKMGVDPKQAVYLNSFNQFNF